MSLNTLPCAAQWGCTPEKEVICQNGGFTDDCPSVLEYEGKVKIPSRIRQMEGRHLQRYETATWQFQRTWGRLAKMLYREVVLLLCRVAVFPIKLLCKCLSLDLNLVIMR
jgi:hypothetical protein